MQVKTFPYENHTTAKSECGSWSFEKKYYQSTLTEEVRFRAKDSNDFIFKLNETAYLYFAIHLFSGAWCAIKPYGDPTCSPSISAAFQ